MHKHITYKERVSIALYIARGKTHEFIANEIGVHKSTIGREYDRNKCFDGVYRARKAHKRAQNRRRGLQENKKVIENDTSLYEYITKSLKFFWSPEQISGRLKKEGKLNHVSHTTIYTFIKREVPELKKYLRHKRHRRRSITPQKQLNKRMIDERPKIASNRKRIGDWEGDTIVGKNRKDRILTHVDRRSGYLLANKSDADSYCILNLTRVLFNTIPCHTITYDNGSEFASFERIEEETRSKVYFAYPGKPEQRGTNENTNGLLRQFFPKGSCFGKLKERHVRTAVNLINNRPRKRLGYCTPLEVFLEEMNRLQLRV